MQSFKWKKEKLASGPIYPTSREGHSLTYISKHHKLLLFGGLSHTRLNDLFLYDLNTNTWSEKQTTGRSPTARCYHQSFYDEQHDHFFIYGGSGDKNRSLGDFYFLHLKDWVWKRIFIMEVPPSRNHHTMTASSINPKEKIIFGGICLPENQLLNDVWTFNYEKLNFSHSINEVGGAVCSLQKCSGDIPSTRMGHIAFCHDRYHYIFGGTALDKDENTSILYQLNLDNYMWRKIQTIDKAPSPRSHMSCNMFTNNRVLIFGGLDNDLNKATNEVYTLQLNDFFWSAPFTAGYKPQPRYNHASTLIQAQNQTFLAIQGGLDHQFHSMDIQMLHEHETQENQEWEKLQEPTEIEKITSEKAGLSILGYKQQIYGLDDLIAKERKFGIELEKRAQKLEDDMVSQERKNESRVSNLDKELFNETSQHETHLKKIDSMCMMIKSEQLYQQDIQQKNKLLEETLQKIQEYMISMDQFFSVISKNKWDPNDKSESQIQKLLEAVREDVQKQKDQHKESLYKLKKCYEKTNQAISKCETDINLIRKELILDNNELEKVICETENEEM